jgi:glycine/serine hydroxymethyltransferase
MGEQQMPVIASLVARALRAVGDAETLAVIGKEVAELCARFPAYPS